jgi:hypothetical protein
LQLEFFTRFPWDALAAEGASIEKALDAHFSCLPIRRIPVDDLRKPLQGIPVSG